MFHLVQHLIPVTLEKQGCNLSCLTTRGQYWLASFYLVHKVLTVFFVLVISPLTSDAII